MPTYDYSCPKCGRVETVLHTIAELKKPSVETKKEITCDCVPKGTRMKLHFESAPGIVTQTGSKPIYNADKKERVAIDRRKRSTEHFKKEVYPTLAKEDRLHFAKKHNLKA